MALKQTFIEKGVEFKDIYHKITNRANIHDYQKVVQKAVEAVDPQEAVLDEEGNVVTAAIEEILAVDEVEEKWYKAEIIISRFSDETKQDQWEPLKMIVDQAEDSFSLPDLYVWLVKNEEYFKDAVNC